MEIDMDDDALIAGVDLIGRTGARGVEIGWLHDDVPVEHAGWYAQVRYHGTRVIEEEHRSPVAAVEALARRLLTGAMCTHCRGPIALSDLGAMVYPGAHRTDGTIIDSAEVERLKSMRHCRYRRIGNQWVRGCEQGVKARGGRQRGPKAKPNRRRR